MPSLKWTTHPFLVADGFTAALPSGEQISIVPKGTHGGRLIHGPVVGWSARYFRFTGEPLRPGEVSYEDIWPDGTTGPAVMGYTYSSPTKAKKAAELFFARLWPLHALAQATTPRIGKNPELKSIPLPAKNAGDLEGIKRARWFLSRAYALDTLPQRLGRTATSDEERQATTMHQLVNTADWKALNQLLSPFLAGGVRPPSGYRPLADIRPFPVRETVKSPPMNLTREQQKHLRTLAKKELWSVFRQSLRDLDIDGLVSEIITRWWTTTRGEQEPTANDFRAIAQQIRRESRATQAHEVRSDETVRQAGTAPEVERERPAPPTLSGRIQEMLRSPDPSVRIRAVISGLHLGMRLLPEQPPALTHGVRGSGIRGSGGHNVPSAHADLIRYHGTGGRSREECPTCRRISRFVRVQGLGPKEVGQIVDSFAVQLQQETGG
jgi:hypothetical protein